MKKLLFIIATLFYASFAAFAQDENLQSYKPIKLAGPRAGLTYVAGPLGKKLDEFGISRYLSQIGWQFETRYFETRDGLQGLVEAVALLGGFETSEPVVSGSLLVGFRTRHGFEAGIGPNLSSAGGGTNSLVLAIGHTYKNDNVYIPVNFAVVPSDGAMKYTFLVGFILRSDR